MKQGARTKSFQEGCIFCLIVEGAEPASIIYEDEQIMSFMTIRPTRPGECLIVPRQHIDHFTDIDDELSVKIILIGQKIARKIRDVFQPRRVGMVVHGFGVGHAHLIIVPQHDPNDITSARFAYLNEGEIAFDATRISKEDRSTLDEQANMLRIDQAEA